MQRYIVFVYMNKKSRTFIRLFIENLTCVNFVFL